MCANPFIVGELRLRRLLGRGFLLSQAIERWQTRAIWVLSRADPAYPHRLKVRLRDEAPAVLYGCGDIGLLESGGLVVVGSRHVDDTLIDYAMAVGRLAAQAGRTLVSGGAKGIDQAAMRGALESGGKACGILPDRLEKTAINRENRNFILDQPAILIMATVNHFMLSQLSKLARLEAEMSRNIDFYALLAPEVAGITFVAFDQQP